MHATEPRDPSRASGALPLITHLNQRETALAAFLVGMLVMGVLFLAFGSSVPHETIVQNEQCEQSIAVANALHQFVAEHHGVLLYPDGTRILREETIADSRWRLGVKP